MRPRGKSWLGVLLASIDFAKVEARVAAVPQEELDALTAEVMKPTTGMRDFMKDPARRYKVLPREGNRKERRTKAKQQRCRRRQNR